MRLLKSRLMACGLAVAAALSLAACDVAYPVAVVGENGAVFRGAATNTFLQGGQFHATNGDLVCQGRYTKQLDIQTVQFPVTCSNGLSGIGTAHFETELRGGGDIVMTDGSKWRFLFGQSAAGF